MNLPFKNKPVKRTLFIILTVIVLISILLLILFIYSTCLNGNGSFNYNPSIYLLSDGFHSGILIPNYNNLFQRVFDETYRDFKFVHYTFAEESWYLDGNRTFFDAFPTLFAPTDGVIERTFVADSFTITEAVTHFNYAFEIDIWSFRSAEHNLINIIKHIEEDEIADKNPIVSYKSRQGFIFDFFHSFKKYSLFYNCHHFNLDMLRLNGMDCKAEWYVCLDFLLRISADSLVDK